LLDLIENIAIGVALALLGIGVGVMSMSPPDYNLARTATIGFAVAIVIATLLWLSTTSHPQIARVIIALLAAAVVFGGCPITYRWINDRERNQQLYAGRLNPQGIINDGHLQAGAQIQIGRSHVVFMESVFPDALSALKGDRFTIEKIDGKLMVSTMIRDSSGSVLAELRRNEWKVAPSPKTWDRNYTDNALEVVNAEGYVVLQVKLLENIVQLQGSWWVDLGPPNGKLRLVIREAPPSELQGNFSAQIIVCPSADAVCGQIAPIFEYPSDLHLGELR
jgi:hypothetical protein